MAPCDVFQSGCSVRCRRDGRGGQRKGIVLPFDDETTSKIAMGVTMPSIFARSART
jgi:hypothetical protein